MPSFEASTSIAASREVIWHVLAGVVTWPEWLPTVTSVEPLDVHALKQGARYRVLQPKLRPATWVVTQLDAPRRFVWESSWPGVRVIGDHIIDDTSRGATRVRLRITFSGALGFLVALMARSVTQRYLDQEAAALKSKVENH